RVSPRKGAANENSLPDGRALSGRPSRSLRLELRALAGRCFLPAPPAGFPLARLLRRALRHGRGELDLLPPAASRRGGPLGRADAAGLSLRNQGIALPHAHQAAPRPRAGPRAVSRTDRAAAALAEARAALVAAAADLSPRRRAPCGRARAAAVRASPLCRVPRPVLVRRGHVRAPA